VYDICTICKNTQYVPDMYMKNVCFSAFILHISDTDRCKINVKYIIFRPIYTNDVKSKPRQTKLNRADKVDSA
jgi:hypothetical protein